MALFLFFIHSTGACITVPEVQTSNCGCPFNDTYKGMKVWRVQQRMNKIDLLEKFIIHYFHREIKVCEAKEARLAVKVKRDKRETVEQLPE